MVMLSEKDEFVYHEMIAHTALFSHPNPERVLIIGGGDGGTAREVMKHPAVQHLDLVEIDRNVVEASRLHFPDVGDFENPKINLLFEDGIAFVKDVTEPYDVIIIDGSDPVGPAEGLFKKEFYQSCYEALNEDGILTSQTESPWVKSYHKSIQDVFRNLKELFPVSSMYLCFIPLYPAGTWSMAFASKNYEACDSAVQERIKNSTFAGNLRYYNSEIHYASFALPNFVKDIVR